VSVSVRGETGKPQETNRKHAALSSLERRLHFVVGRQQRIQLSAKNATVASFRQLCAAHHLT
jgi:hypothetical protein